MNAALLQSGVQQRHIHPRMAAGGDVAKPAMFTYSGIRHRLVLGTASSWTGSGQPAIAPWPPAPHCRHFPLCHLAGEALDEDRAPPAKSVHGGDRSPSCGTSAPVGVPLAKGIRPLGRQWHRPSSDTASLGTRVSREGLIMTKDASF